MTDVQDDEAGGPGKGAATTCDNDDEERLLELATDQTLDDGTTAASVVAPKQEPAAPIYVSINTDALNKKKSKQDISPSNAILDEHAETSPGGKTINDGAARAAHLLGGRENSLLNFDDDDVEANDAVLIHERLKSENSNQINTLSNDADLPGVPQGETSNSSLNVNDLVGYRISSDRYPTHTMTEKTLGHETNHHLWKMSSWKNASNSTQQPNSEVAAQINIKLPISLGEKKINRDAVECPTTRDSHIELTNVNEDVSGEKISDDNSNGEGPNQSESENTSAIEPVNSCCGKKGGMCPNSYHKENPPLGVTVGVEKYAYIDESRERGNLFENMMENEGIEGNHMAVKGVTELGDDHNHVTSLPEKRETYEAESITNEVDETAFSLVSPVPMDEAASAGNVSPHCLVNSDKSRSEAGVSASVGCVNADAESRTAEEEEWLSMGLGLGDALRQIVALTDERDSAFSICQEKDSSKTQVEALLTEVQLRLELEMNLRAEFESEVHQVRESLKLHEERLATYQTIEDDLEKAQASLVRVVSDKSKIELEVQKLREMRDESEQKEVVLSNRLNEAKKKEANRSTAAGRLEADNENIREELQRTKDELENISKAKVKLESNMEKLKAKAVERVKQAEIALSEERELNEERKKKMKVFVETKADELREAKESANNMQKELEETRASLRSSRDREDISQKQLEEARLKHRELQRDMERMKRNSEQLHRMGNSLEHELEKSASETNEHKKKRMTAKHEIMQMVRTLEAERTMSTKLKESVKFTFTPKALSQQELLTECLRDFELELDRLAAKMGKTLRLSSESSEQSHDVQTEAETSEINGSSRKMKKTRGSKADMDTERLISNLEQETQHVSKGIMALAVSVERMRSLLNEDSMFGCMTYFTNILAGSGEARHQPLRGSDTHQDSMNDQFI